MKKLLFLIFAISYTLLFSQKTEKYSGILTLENGTPIMFEMEFIQEKSCMDEPDIAIVYFSPEAIAHKKLQPITKDQVHTAFGKKIY